MTLIEALKNNLERAQIKLSETADSKERDRILSEVLIPLTNEILQLKGGEPEEAVAQRALLIQLNL
jgi:hypothetical protein